MARRSVGAIQMARAAKGIPSFSDVALTIGRERPGERHGMLRGRVIRGFLPGAFMGPAITPHIAW
jgi:hypothetical protein